MAGERWLGEAETERGSSLCDWPISQGELPCTKTANPCGKPPPIRRALSARAGETGVMQTPHTSRWSLPRRLRNEGWWLIEPQRLRVAADILLFAPRSRHVAGTPRTVRR
ncbi:conserved hypothetical protein [Mesorhizobium plurifarium]|uniref:Uncharacterized protein n=1 Tax=Mesorhizobium plurifarium TaxID=69974 RepID=A0A090FFS1_MESPL|nr:conserved hypothetical protein [Mesorhizobium plurifarium]